MGHYKSNIRDLEFNLVEVLHLEKVLASGEFGDLDVDTVREMLSEAARLAEGPVAESFAESDRHPPTFDPATHSVTLPEPFTESLQAWVRGEWFRIGLDEAVGGVPAPAMVSWALNELPLGAQPAVFIYLAGPVLADILYHVGNEEQKRWATTAVERLWGATMVLTEPDAGSDVGAGRTKAIEQPDGTWHIDGVKRFITSGDAGDMFENILHLVLARPEGAGPGTKGLSLFLVPKFLFDPETGEPGQRNGVFVTNVEHKMGLKVSATCELTFGQHGIPAVGYLVGDSHNGIAQMFKVIEYARMMVGTKAISTLSTGYLNALEYARTRVQGADMTEMSDKTAPRVTIIHHPDVRRALMTQKAYAEGLRALYLYTAAHQDETAAAVISGADAAMAGRINDLLLPIVKGLGSERAWVLLGTESLQTFGGSGFLQEYPVEQYVRDAKIDTLYEGTTAIQGLDFFFRKIIRDKAQALSVVSMQIQEFAKDLGQQGGTLDKDRELLAKGVEDVQGIVTAMVGQLMSADPRTGGDVANVYKVGQNTSRILLAAGDLIVGWLLLRQAAIAQDKLDAGADGADKDFYTGKVAAAQFYARNVLPKLAAERAIAEAMDNSLMDVPEAAF